MPELLIYPREELPPELNWQIISFLRIRAPDTFAGFDWLKYWAGDEENDHSHHIVLVHDGILVSHTEVVWKYLKHAVLQGNHVLDAGQSHRGGLEVPQARWRNIQGIRPHQCLHIPRLAAPRIWDADRECRNRLHQVE